VVGEVLRELGRTGIKRVRALGINDSAPVDP